MQSNAFEVQSAQIALQKTRNARIRTYAKDALRDHRAANVALSGGATGSMGAMADGGPIGGLIGAPLAVAGVRSARASAPRRAPWAAPSRAARSAASRAWATARRRARRRQPPRRRRDGGEHRRRHDGPPNQQQQAMLAELSATPAGPRFDRLYVSQQVQSHQMAIGMTQAYAQNGPNRRCAPTPSRSCRRCRSITACCSGCRAPCNPAQG